MKAGIAERITITGELRDTETVMRGSERGCWKSASKDIFEVTRWQPTLHQVRFSEGGVEAILLLYSTDAIFAKNRPYPALLCALFYGYIIFISFTYSSVLF